MNVRLLTIRAPNLTDEDFIVIVLQKMTQKLLESADNAKKLLESAKININKALPRLYLRIDLFLQLLLGVLFLNFPVGLTFAK